NLIDNDKRIELISKFFSLPIIGHSIGMNHLVDSLEFYINNKSILDTPFSYIFDAVFTLEKDKKNSLIEMCSMFSDLLNKNNSDIEIGRIHSLLDVWLVRNSFDTRENMLARWFVITCLNTKYIPEHKLIPRGKGHAKLLDIYINMSGGRSINNIISDVCEVILKLDAGKASDTYDMVKLAFVEGSKESE